MGKNYFSIDDEHAHFAQEYPGKPIPERQWHLCLSGTAPQLLENALCTAEVRAKQSTISVRCRLYNPKRDDLKSTFVWYRELQIILLPVMTMQDPTIIAYDKTAKLTIDRNGVSVLHRICNLLKAGVDDFSVEVGASDSVWIWGSGMPV
jgi:hypothetical protein